MDENIINRKNSRQRSFFRSLAILLAGMAILLVLTGNAISNEGEDSLRVSGSSTLQPFVAQLTEVYKNKTGQPMQVSGGGSSAGVADAIAGKSQVGMTSRALKPEEKKDLQFVTVGLDSLVFIVNKRNPLEGITKREVVDLFSGQINSWNKLSKWDRPVILVSKEVGRATLDLFEGYSGLHHPKRTGRTGPAISREVIEIGSNLESLTLTGGLPGAIGYCSLATASAFVADGMPVRILELDGIRPKVRNVVSGAYPIKRELNLVFAEKTAAVEALLEAALASKGQKKIKEMGFIPVN